MFVCKQEKPEMNNFVERKKKFGCKVKIFRKFQYFKKLL